MPGFQRPNQFTDLQASPEMALRYPDESGGSFGTTANERRGTAFDNGSPMAYGERWFNCQDDFRDVETWFLRHLTELGWVPGEPSTDMRTFRRSLDEYVGVALIGPRYRIHYAVDGRWADGSLEFRPQ